MPRQGTSLPDAGLAKLRLESGRVRASSGKTILPRGRIRISAPGCRQPGRPKTPPSVRSSRRTVRDPGGGYADDGLGGLGRTGPQGRSQLFAELLFQHFLQFPAAKLPAEFFRAMPASGPSQSACRFQIRRQRLRQTGTMSAAASTASRAPAPGSETCQDSAAGDGGTDGQPSATARPDAVGDRAWRRGVGLSRPPVPDPPSTVHRWPGTRLRTHRGDRRIRDPAPEPVRVRQTNPKFVESLLLPRFPLAAAHRLHAVPARAARAQSQRFHPPEQPRRQPPERRAGPARPARQIQPPPRPIPG